MKGVVLSIYNRRRRLLLMLIDVVILTVATVISAYIAWPDDKPWGVILRSWATVLVLLLICMLFLKTYRHIWRFAGSKELLNLINAYFLTCAVDIIIELIAKTGVPVEFTLCSVLAAALASAYVRVLHKTSSINKSRRKEESAGEKRLRPMAIIGAGACGVALMREMQQNNNAPYTIWGFFDDDKEKIGRSINGITVRGSIDDMPTMIKMSEVHDLVLAIPSLDVERRREIMRLCDGLNCKLKIMPDIILTMENSTNRLAKSLREIKIEDLLGRSSIFFKDDELLNFLRNKTVLVTGGGGSIGSELCRQIVAAGAKKLIIFDINENTSYLLQNEILHQIDSGMDTVVEIGSMTDIMRVRDVFRRYNPEVVFHAAAHKHVPLMEHCPYEAVKNNIFGTYNVITTASEENVGKLVLISTDKAVNPTSVMGATKRYCENLMLALSKQPGNKTCFVSVRFGNVLGSAGSVIPIFKEQIAHGGPVTITDMRVTRYFMTISEAVGLVLKSGAMASSSETYILDMGSPVKIIELAENLIRLCGMEPYKDIPIVEIGLRPGEKLFEELLVNDVEHTATKESKIFVERNGTTVDWHTIAIQMDELMAATDNADNAKVLQLLHCFVPGYIEADNDKRGAEKINSAEYVRPDQAAFSVSSPVENAVI